MTTTLLLETKEAQMRNKLQVHRERLIELRSNAENVLDTIEILKQTLTTYNLQIEKERTAYHVLDRKLAFRDGRLQVIKAKKHVSKSRRATIDPTLRDLTSGQLSYLKSAIATLMKEKSNK